MVKNVLYLCALLVIYHANKPWVHTTPTSLDFLPRPKALVPYNAHKPLFPAKTISLGFLPDPQALVSNCAYKPWFLTGQQALVSYNAHAQALVSYSNHKP